MGRGRKANPKLSLEEQEDEVICKYICGEEMNYEDVALALWMMDGRKTAKPMTKMGAFKLVNRVLLKLKATCEKNRISKEDVLDMIGSRRQYAKISNFESPSSDY